MTKERLKEIREGIDRVDRDILKLIEDRVNLAREAGELKKKLELPMIDLARERQVISEILAQAGGKISGEALKRIFTEVISACRSVQESTRVCFLGPEATFTHVAAMDFFGRSATYLPMDTIHEVFRKVESGRVDFGVVPVENSTEGTVGLTLDQFTTSNINICGEICLKVSQALLTNAKRMTDIRRVFSHPQALAQCRGWLSKNLPQASLEMTSSTGAAAGKAAEDPKFAAIGGEILAERHGLGVLANDIQDKALNITRFFVLCRSSCSRTGRDKTSLWFTAPHRPGSLHECIKPFADCGVNLTRIESRPGDEGPWEYVFFLDLEGHIEDENVKKAIEQLKMGVEKVRIMGSYARAELNGG